MIFKNNKARIHALLVAVFTLVSFAAYAQFSIFTPSKSGQKKKNKPTVITSESMDFDITKNVAVFTGNVQVDDVDIRILCHKMIIQFSGGRKSLQEIENASGKDKGTQVKDITCLKNVIIIRKLYGDEKEKGEQKALAGKAHYEVQSGKITLTENPVLMRGQDTLRGEVIIFWRDSERVSVRGGKKTGSELKLRSNSFKNQNDRD